MAATDTNITETTPAAITPAVEQLAAVVGASPPIFVRVVDDQYGLYGFCNTGVLEKVRNDGGQICFGWTIWEWPGVFLTAEFHSLWVDPDGQYADITPKPQQEPRIVFAPAREYEPDFDFGMRPRNSRLRAYHSSFKDDELSRRLAKMSDPQRKYEEARAAAKGMTVDELLKQKLAADPLEGLIDSFLSICEQFDEHRDRLDVHRSGNLLADETLMRLMEKRAKLLARVRDHFRA